MEATRNGPNLMDKLELELKRVVGEFEKRREFLNVSPDSKDRFFSFRAFEFILAFDELNSFEANQSALAAKDATTDLLAAQNEWLKDRLADLQLPSNSTKNIEEWLVECGMPSPSSSVRQETGE